MVKIDVSKLREIKRTLPGKFDDALRGAAEEIASDIKLSFNTGPGGRTYQRGNVSHVASQPGYPPNVDIGTLKNSIRAVRGNHQFQHFIVDGVEYGVELELGRERVKARPFFTPVMENWRNRKFANFLSDVGLL